MEKQYKIRKNIEFKKVYKYGKSYWNRNLILYKNKSKLDVPRIGVTITKKFGKANLRNRTRRRIQEIVRLNIHRINKGYDLIFIPKHNVLDITHDELESAILHILKVSGLLKD